MHALAREAASRTGRTQTSVIEVALTQLVAELDARGSGADRREHANAIVADMQCRVEAATVDLTTKDPYDDAGLSL